MPALARSADHNNRTMTMTDAQLSGRHRLMVEYMLHGVSHASLCERTRIVDGYDPDTGHPILRHPRVGEPIDLKAAAQVVGIRPRNATSLSKQPAFQRLLAAETQAFRDGARARAVRRMVHLIDEPGAGKAADHKVQLTAALATLGEAGNTTNVAVNINNGIQAAGLVIDLREDDEPDDRTIEHVP